MNAKLTHKDKVDWLSEAFPHLDKKVISQTVSNYPSASIDTLCDKLLANKVCDDTPVIREISKDPRTWTPEEKLEQERQDYLLAKKLYEEEVLKAERGVVDNTLLAQLHSERLSRRPTSTSRKDSAFLASVHEKRLAKSKPGEVIDLTVGRDAIKIQKQQKMKQPSIKEQMRSVRNKLRAKWRESSPTGKIMTLRDLEKKELLIQKSKAGDWGQATPKTHTIHTLQNTIYDPDRIGREALKYTNEFRAKHNLPPLQWSQALAEIGKVHSKNMGDGKVPFGHAGFSERVAKYPFPSRSAAENVAMSSGTSDIARVAVDGWIQSPGHRKNLLSNHNYCGIGVAQNAKGAWYLTQLFGLL